MCFDRPCGYVPELHECFCLPVDTLILDFKYRLESADDLDLLVDWIHGGGEATRTLCLKRFDFGDTAISQLVAKMRQRFLQDSEPHPFLFKIEKDENVDELWDDNDAWETDMTHPVTGERLVVENEVQHDEMHISRC
ncbi:hypothetical protein AAVH_22566 [Aphelenchoides avenae]|nr:hypothetical protein AAVH_34219 [Aphelenchus avenae]KAH7710161.1 hypothetical protein AAVH_22566 [Aphelenchus avenae]